MVSQFSGKKYKLDKSDKFDEYMTALGVPLVTRKLGNTISPVLELVVNGDEYTIKSNSTFKNMALTFKLNNEFETDTADSRKVKSIFTLEGNKLIEVQKWDGKTSTIVREFSDSEVKITMTMGDVVSVRIYKAC